MQRRRRLRRLRGLRAGRRRMAARGGRVRFYLGTHKPGWLRTSSVPLMVSRRQLAGYKTLPRAAHGWMLDSAAFTEIQQHGRWTIGARAFAAEVRRFFDEVGNLRWVACQDWMCEPFMLAKTGLTVSAHQLRTVVSYATLLEIAPDLPWMPVLQGYALDDYRHHVDAYADAG